MEVLLFYQPSLLLLLESQVIEKTMEMKRIKRVKWIEKIEKERDFGV